MPPAASLPARLIRRILLSPLAMRLKATARNVVWTLRGRAYRNPEWPAGVQSIAFVCFGNICRSPFAALLAEQRLAQAGIPGVKVVSAGLRAKQAAAPPGDAVRTAATYGIRLDGHRPTPLTREMVLASDVVFVMEPWHLDEARRRWPDQQHRFFLMSHFDVPPAPLGAYDRLHLTDPFGRGEAAFVDSYARIARTVDCVIGRWRR